MRRTGSFGSTTSLFEGLQNASLFLQAATRGQGSADGVDSPADGLFGGVEDALDSYVTAESAQVGQLVTLNLKEFKGKGIPRFPGDTGPGCLLEDHFGDGTMWRVRWITTNAWGIYSTGFEGEHHLMQGTALADEWDSECFTATGRMPSFFFCAPLGLTAEDRKSVHEHSSPRSRIFLPTEEDMINPEHEDKLAELNPPESGESKPTPSPEESARSS